MVSRMVRAQKNNANRRIDGEQREIELKHDHIEERERGPVRKCERAEPGDDVITRSP
jgi:hypothetical protein